MSTESGPRPGSRRGLLLFLIVFVGVSALTACKTVEKLAGGIRRPRAEVVGAEMTGLSFEAIAFRFDVRLENPNPIGVELAGFDYELLVDGSTFVRGSHERGLRIEAEGESIVPIPVEFRFEELLRSVRSLADENETAYTITTGFTFDLPVLDRVRVAASKSGTFPVVRFPDLGVRALHLRSLSLRGAELGLRLRVSNPNAFAFFLNTLEYELRVEGKRWASGTMRERMEVERDSSSVLEIPIGLDLINMGRSVYALLEGSDRIRYDLSVDIGGGAALPLAEPASFSFVRSGMVPLVR